MSDTKHRILIAEDEPLIAGAIAQKFKLEGFDVSVAKDGQAGLAMALADHPDVILLDVIMPVLDGLGMLKKLRKDKWGEQAKVILWTNVSDAQQVSDRLKYGVFDYLVKSDWTPEEVVRQVKQKLGYQ
jgi:DNA-binding response OmpR family regulator